MNLHLEIVLGEVWIVPMAPTGGYGRRESHGDDAKGGCLQPIFQVWIPTATTGGYGRRERRGDQALEREPLEAVSDVTARN